jgi:hypothetical protein
LQNRDDLVEVTMTDRREQNGVFDLVGGLTVVDAAAFDEFRQAMAQDVIPNVIKIVDQRRLLAATSRTRQLKS